MPGQTQQTQQTSQNTTTNPYAPTQPALQKLIDQYGQQSTDVTGAQKSALDNLTSSASGIPNFGSNASGAVSNLFNSSTAPQVGMLQGALGSLQGQLGGAANPANNNPYNTPGFSDALKTMTQDITNSTKGVYAGSGRDPSGAGSFAQSLGRGLTQGEAPTLANQYNTNVANQQGAASTLFGAAGNTASGITGQQQVPLANASNAIGLLPGAATAYTAPGATQLGAANTAYQTPYGNLAQMLAPISGIAGLGGQSTGSGTSTTTQPQNMWSNIMAGGLGLSALLSDERLKENKREVGKLHDGQKIYAYNFKGSPRTEIGLLAQKVKKTHPEAVGMLGGMMTVDYGKATKDAERAA